MSSETSSNDSDNASTTGSSAGSAASETSTVSSNASGASAASTAPSTAPSVANSTSSEPGSTGANESIELEKWFKTLVETNGNSKVASWLQASENPDPTSATQTATEIMDASKLFENYHPGAYKIPINGQLTTFICFDAKDANHQTIEVDGVTTTLTCEPADPGQGNTFKFVPSDNPATANKTSVRPSLDPYLKLPEPTIRPKPEWFKSFDPRKAKRAKSMEINDWDTSYVVAPRHQAKGSTFDAKTCHALDLNDACVMNALRKSEGSLWRTKAATFEKLDKASHLLTATEKVPTSMASAVVKGVHMSSIHDDYKPSFKDALESEFDAMLKDPYLPVTQNGLSTDQWASTVVDNGEVKWVDGVTANGRLMMMRQEREYYYNLNDPDDPEATKITFDDATDAACKTTDWYHLMRDHAKGTGPKREELKAYATGILLKGEKLPDAYPPSLAERVKTREEAEAAFAKSSTSQSRTPTRFNSPRLPRKVKNYSTPETNTTAPTTQTAQSTVGRLKGAASALSQRSIGAVNGFFRSFPKRVSGVGG